MSMGNSDPKSFKRLFIGQFLQVNKGDKNAKMPLDKFIEAVLADEELDEMPYVRIHLTDELVNKKVLGTGGEVSLDFLKKEVSDEAWRNITAAFSYDPSNDPDSELYYLYKHEIVNVLKDATYYGAISKEIFLKTYQDLNGSLRKGRELFDQVSSDGATVSWYDVVDKDAVFDIFGKEHDRGDSEMFERNNEIRDKAAKDMAESMKYMNVDKAEL